MSIQRPHLTVCEAPSTEQSTQTPQVQIMHWFNLFVRTPVETESAQPKLYKST